ncbi:ribosome-recycling factor [Plakobranchus ocellatus]|uniref:Ribosome-recycling factor n=1 Tax=Plakobranchus ocellatus TaxID=259542 RepID=A0AAV3Z7I8_9GAST|nr:ribosome-recycling factor [Plakobranchus ocellatus]
MCPTYRKLGRTLDHTFCHTWTAFLSQTLIVCPRRQGPVVHICQLRYYEPCQKVSYELDFVDEPRQPIPLERNGSTKLIQDHVPLYTERLKIKPSTFRDLQALKSVIPTDYFTFYDKLPS